MLFRLQRRVGLIPVERLGQARCALFWSMLGWLPVALWAFHVERVLPDTFPEPLLAHYGVHVRRLIAVPLPILAEGPAGVLVQRALRHFVETGMVLETRRARFDAVVRSATRLRDSTLPRVVIGASVIAVVSVSEVVFHPHETDWTLLELAELAPGCGGLWYSYVGRSIFYALAFAWLWRLALQIPVKGTLLRLLKAVL